MTPMVSAKGMIMEFSYYPGCSLKGSATDLDRSFRAAAGALGMKLVELPDWTCCGASSAHMVDKYLEEALPAADLLNAEMLGNDIVAPCAACHLRIKSASMKLMEDRELRSRFPFKGSIRTLSGLEIFSSEDAISRLRSNLKRPLSGLRVVPYYGCLAVRPPEVVEPDDPENPAQMDLILEALGVDMLKWPYKTDCCGGSLSLTRSDLVMKLSQKLLDMAVMVDADAIVTMCPMCQANLDTRQGDISRTTGRLYHTPIFYVTELIGLAMEDPNSKSWLAKHLVSCEPVLEMRGIL